METKGLSFRDLRNAILFAVFVYFLIAFIHTIARILLVFAIATLIVISLSPTITWMSNRGIPRWAGTGIITLVLIGFFGGILAYIAPVAVEQFRQLIAELPGLYEKFRGWLESLSNRLPITGDLTPNLSLSTIERLTRPLLGGITTLTSGSAALIADLIVIFFITVYSLANPTPLVDGFLNAFHPDHKTRAATAGQRLAIQIWAWAKGTAIAILSIFLLTWIALSLLGFKQALLFALIAGMLEIVPILGPILSAVPPIIVALVTDPILALWVALTFTVIQQVESNVLIPVIMSRQINLHPVTVLFTVLVMGSIFGLVGIFLATPTAIVVGVLYDELYICEYRKRCEVIPTAKAEDEEVNRQIKEEAEQRAHEQMQRREQETPEEGDDDSSA